MLSFLGVSPAEAEAEGLLLAGVSESADGSLRLLLDPAVLGLVDWAVVATQVPVLLALVLMTVLCLVIYLGAFELAGDLELDWNSEFRVTGLASMAAGGFGTPPGCLSLPPSLRNRIFGVDTRLAGITTALFVAVVCFFGNADAPARAHAARRRHAAVHRRDPAGLPGWCRFAASCPGRSSGSSS